MSIQERINQYLNGRLPNERFASFDYCYNYFYSFYKDNRINKLAAGDNLQSSCLQLGFYLASWGMMRASFLLKKSAKHYKKLIEAISKMDKKLWEIDVDNYTKENIELLLRCKEDIKVALGKENNPSDTLVSKIMLGVFANIPAFDRNVRKSLNVRSISEKSLLKIRRFYDANKSALNSFEVYTLNFPSSKETNVKYTKAKLIDMYGFIDGQNGHDEKANIPHRRIRVRG